MMSQPEGKVGDAAMSSSNFNLFDLPDLVLDEILERLDSTSLKKMRAVCHKTKSLVERPKYLERLSIYMDSNLVRLQEIMNSPVQWNSFNIDMTHLEDSAVVSSIIQMVRPRLVKLKIHGRTIKPEAVATVLTIVGPTLRTFVFDGNLKAWNTNQIDVDVQEMRDILEKSHRSLEQNLIGVQNVIYSTRGNCRLHCVSLLLCKFLEYSPGLVTLKFPLIPIYNLPNFGLGLDGWEEVHCAPLLSYLARNKHMSKIDFGYRHLGTYGLRSGHRSPFPLSKSILLKLVKLCEPMGVKLYNIPSSALPNRHYLNPHSEQCYQKCVASILCTNPVRGIPDTDFVPSGCPIKLFIQGNPQLNFSQFKLSESLNLVSICFQCDPYRGESYNIETLTNTLFRMVRTSVLELKLSNIETTIQVVSLRNRLSSVFPNLKKLRLWNDFDNGMTEAVRFGDWLTDHHELEEIYMDSTHYEEYFQVEEGLGQQLAKLRKLKRIEMNGCNAVMKFSTG